MRSFIVFLLSVLVLISCTEKKVQKVVEVAPDLTLFAKSFPKYIKEAVESDFYLVCKEKLPYYDSVVALYEDEKFKPFYWNVLTIDSSGWEDVKTYFNYIETHGVDRRYYHFPLIDHYRSEIANMTEEDSAYRIIAEIDFLLAHAYVESYFDVTQGRTDPRELYGATYMLPKRKMKQSAWNDFFYADGKKDIIEAYHEGDTAYARLRDMLALYKENYALDRSTQIDFSQYKKISPGDTVDILPLVIQRLKRKLLPDSSILKIEEDTIYRRAFSEVIKTLQEKNNLAADGVMGYKTYKVINSSTEDQIKEIIANLERARWFRRPSYEEAPFVYVNLPEYMVYLFYPDSFQSMKVCIGKNLPDEYDAMVKRYTDSGWVHKLPKDMETPQIYARVSMVVINPTWTVPKSIIKNEMYWQMRRDPKYLTRNHYVVYKGDSLLDAENINWSRFKPNTVPYRIVQVPGDFNALGRVKYIFWNKFDIFMHDTPQKKKFDLPQRAVSHGCVRLENPLLFGEFVMQGSDEYNSDDFRIMMGYEPLDSVRLEEWDPEDSTAAIQPIDTTYKIRLRKPIPLYMDYKTIVFDSVGSPQFIYDIYDRNKYILREMNLSE